MQIAEAFVEVQMRLQGSSVSRAKTDVKRAATQMERDGKVKLDADGKPLKRELDKAERDVEGAARNMVGTFARVFTGAAVVAGMREAIQSATDLGESVNAVNVTFGDAADGVHALGEESATSLGLSTAAFNALAVRFSSFASTIAGPGGDVAAVLDDMTTRAADFASVMNIDVAEAANLFQSGLAGESEPLRQYGIDLSAAAVEAHALEVGINDGTHALTEAEKVQARYSLLMQETSQVAGDFANTSDSAANKQRILAAEFENAKAKLGSALLPIYGQAIGVLTELVEIFTQLPAPVQAGIVAMLGVVAVAGPVRDATKAFGGLSSVIGKLGKAGGPLLGLTVAVGAAALIVNSLGKEQRELEKRSREVGEALGTQWRETLRVALQSEGAETAVAGLAAANAALSNAITQTGDDGAKLTTALGTLGRQTDEAADILLKFGEDSSDAFIALLDLGVQAGLTAGQAATMARIVNETDDEWDVMARAATELGEEYVGIALAMEEVQDQAEKTDLDAVASDALAAAAATSEQADELINLAEAQVGATRTSDQAVEVYQRFNELLAQSDQETQDAVLGLEEMEAAEAAVIDATDTLAGKAGELTTELDKAGGVVDKVNLKVAGHTTTVKSAGEALGLFAEDAKSAGGGADDLGAALDDAADNVDELRDEVGDATGEFDEMEDAANRLRTAIDKVVGPSDDLRETTRAVWREFEKLAEGLEENGNSYDVATEAGRENQEQLEATRDAVLAHGVAMVGAGESVEAATGDIEYNIEALKEQWRQAGLTEDQIRDLIEQYNLTPEDIETVLRLEGEEAAKATLDRYETNLDKIPAAKRTQIEAAIREGDIARANALLDSILDEEVAVHVRIRNPVIRVPAITVNPTGGGSRYVVTASAYARGGFIGNDEFAQLHANEAVLPLGDARRSRLRELLGDPRIGEPIADAMGGSGAPGMTGGISIGELNVGSREDVPLIYDAMAEVEYLVRHS